MKDIKEKDIKEKEVLQENEVKEEINEEFDILLQAAQERLLSSIYDLENEDLNYDEYEDEVSIRFTEDKKEEPKKVNISDLKVRQTNNIIEKQNALQSALYGSKRSFGIVLSQSGYSATMAPLVHSEITSLLESSLSPVDYKAALYRLVYKKIITTTPSMEGQHKFDFDFWVENTSLEDMETFFFGLFGATYPEALPFKVYCPKCQKEHDYKISHKNLTPNSDKELQKRIREIMETSTTLDEMKKISMVGEGEEGFILPDSGIVVILRTPTILDSLNALRKTPSALLESTSTVPVNLIYTSRLLIPKGNEYIEERDIVTISKTLQSLSITDAPVLDQEVTKRFNENKIGYSIKGLKCAELDCGHDFGEIPVSVENLLFTVIFEKIRS